MTRKKFSVFHLVNYFLLTLLIVICIIPILHVIALSFSQKIEAVAGHVGLIPVGFNLEAYRYVMEDSQFWTSLGVTLLRVVIGVPVNIFLVVMTAYPLSKSNSRFHARTVFSWFFVFTMLFSGGQIPLYMVISKLGMINSIWALTLPGAMNVSYMILMLNFFRGINWNVWMDGYIYMNTPDKYPLQTYLATKLMESKNNVETLMTPEQLARMELVSEKTIEAAQIFLAALPIMCVYPFLQKYYIKGIVVGSVKG